MRTPRIQRALTIGMLILVLALVGLQLDPSQVVPHTPHAPGVFVPLANPGFGTKKQFPCGTSTGVTSGALAAVAGNSIVVLVGLAQGTAFTVSGITDTAGDTFHFIHRKQVASQGDVELWVVNSTIGNAANTVTVSWGTSTRFCVSYTVWGTARNYAVYDAVGTGSTANNATCLDALTTVNDGDSVLVFCHMHGATTWSAANGWGLINTANASSSDGVGQLNQTTHGALNPALKSTISANWVGLSVAIQNPPAPGAPTGLTVTAVTKASVSLSWTNPTGGGIVNNTVYRWSGASCSGTVTATSLGNANTINTQAGLAAATQFAFEVQSWNGTGNGPVSSCVTGTTLPGPVTGAGTGAITTTSIVTSWTNPAGTISNDSIGWTTTACTGTWTYHSIGSAGTSFTIPGLAWATKYCIVISSYSAGGATPNPVFINGTTHAGPPTSPVIGSVTTNSIPVSWTNPNGTLSNVTIFRTTTACTGTWTTASLGVATSNTLTGLAKATKYCIAIEAFSSSGTSSPVFTNGTTLPDGPTGLAAGTVTATSVPLSWSNPAGTLLNSTVYRWTGSSCSGTVTATSIGSPATSNTQSGLAGATAFSFEVQAWSGGGASNVSSCVTATTLPAAATSLTATGASGTSLSVAWTNPSGTLSNVSIFSGTSCGSLSTHTSLGVVTSTTVSGLVAATTYCVEIQVYSAGGHGAPTFANGTTKAGLPTSLSTSSPTVSGITVSWANPSGTISNDTVWVTTNACVAAWSQSISAGVVTTKAVTTLSAATKYCLGVQAWSAGGTTGVSFTNGTTLPNVATGLSIGTITVTGGTATWVNPSGTLSNVTVYVGTTCAGSARVQSNSAGVVTTFPITSLSGATTYCVAVQAFSAGGGSTTLDFANFTTLPGAPTAFSVVSVTTTQVTISWSNPSGTLANDSLLLGTSCSSLTSGASLGVATTANPGGLNPATTYCLQIRAWSASGAGAPGFINATTLPGTPSGLTSPAQGITSANLSWTNPSGTLVNLTVKAGSVCGTWTTSVSAGVVSTYTVTGLPSATPLCFGVFAWSAGGHGGTAFVNATTKSGAVAILWVGQITGSSVQLIWQNPAVSVQNVTVNAGLACGGWQKTISAGPVSTYTVTSLQGETKYCFGISVWSGGQAGPLVYVNATTGATGSGLPPAGGGTNPGGSNQSLGQPVVNAAHSVLGAVGAEVLVALGVVILLIGAALLDSDRWYGWVPVAFGFIFATYGSLTLLSIGVL